MSRSPKEDIYNEIRDRFSVATKHTDKVKRLINEHYLSHSKLNRTTLVLIIKMIREDFTKKEWSEVKYMFTSIFVYIRAHHKPDLFMNNVEEFIRIYPEFSNVTDFEKSLLLQFRNYFTIACEIIDPSNHKGELIGLVGRMCGAVYITGGGQTVATDRRVLIYEREMSMKVGNVKERKRRIGHSANATTSSHQPEEDEATQNKRACYEFSDARALLQSADKFWNYHRALLEKGQESVCDTDHSDQSKSGYIHTNLSSSSIELPLRLQHDPLRSSLVTMSSTSLTSPGRFHEPYSLPIIYGVEPT